MPWQVGGEVVAIAVMYCCKSMTITRCCTCSQHGRCVHIVCGMRRVGVRFGVREGENGVNTDYFRNLNWQTRLLFGPAAYFKFSATILCA